MKITREMLSERKVIHFIYNDPGGYTINNQTGQHQPAEKRQPEVSFAGARNEIVNAEKNKDTLSIAAQALSPSRNN